MKNLDQIIEWMEDLKIYGETIDEMEQMRESLRAIKNTINELNDYDIDDIYDSPTVYQCMNFLREMVGISNNWYEVAVADLEGHTQSIFKSDELSKCIGFFNSKVVDCIQDKEISGLFIDEWHQDDVDGLPMPCNTIMELKFHSRVNEEKEVINTVKNCVNCGKVVVISPEDTNCPHCGYAVYE